MLGQLGPHHYTHLLDLLEVLPLDDVDISTWAPLTPLSKRSFRLICRQSRHLADQLITSTHHDLHPPRLHVDGGDVGQAAVRGEVLWRQAVATHTAFLSRLPRLTSLKLSRWPSESALASDLLLCGAATRSRITKLGLEGEELSADCLRAVRLAFPQLRELDVIGWMDVQGPAFLPLHGAPWLTELSVYMKLDIPDEVLESLAGLATLKQLDLSLLGPNVEPYCLLLLTGLQGLESCAVDLFYGSEATLSDFAALLAVTRLTRLELLTQWGDHLNRQDLASAAAHAAALALLGGLSRLQSLHLGRRFVVDNATFAAVLRLTQLTELSLGGLKHLAAATPPAPHFPLLQHLDAGCSGPSFSPHVLQSLLPLLPLPSLVTLGGADTLIVDVNDGEEQDAAGWSATLHAVLQGLAGSPLLRHPDGVAFQNAWCRRTPLTQRRSMAQLTQLLQPVAAGLLSCVRLTLVLEGVPWGVVHTCWPGLRQLILNMCQVSTGELSALVEGMVTLQRLDLQECGCPEGGLRWAVVAAHCCRPLQVRVGPERVPEEVLVRCRGVQQLLYGVQNIQWL